MFATIILVEGSPIHGLGAAVNADFVFHAVHVEAFTAFQVGNLVSIQEKSRVTHQKDRGQEKVLLRARKSGFLASGKSTE